MIRLLAPYTYIFQITQMHYTYMIENWFDETGKKNYEFWNAELKEHGYEE